MSEVPSAIAAVRGAIQVEANRAELVQSATARLLRSLLERNAIAPAQIVSAIFTATPDLDADFPAHAARQLGWTDVPLLGAVEIAVPGALPRVVRVLLTVQGVPAGSRLAPVYLEGAAKLRPDLARNAAPTEASRDASVAPRTIAIVGLGQIGGSIGLGLAGSGRWRRVGFDRDPGTAARAIEVGAVDEASPSLADACRRAELAVIAVPVDAIPDVVRAAAALLPAGATLTDTGSTRGGITEALRDVAATGVRAIGGHPLAGNEGRGIESARRDLFARERWVVCPTDGREPTAILGDMVNDLGAEIRIAEPDAHDAALARTSHLPYVLARALRETAREPEAAGLFGPAYRGITRVAASDPRVAEVYCRSNLAELRRAWASLQSDVARVIDGLGNPAPEASS